MNCEPRILNCTIKGRICIYGSAKLTPHIENNEIYGNSERTIKSFDKSNISCNEALYIEGCCPFVTKNKIHDNGKFKMMRGPTQLFVQLYRNICCKYQFMWRNFFIQSYL